MTTLLAMVILASTALMLAIHVSAWWLVRSWYGARDSWTGRVLTPIRLLRLEAAYWTLALAAWTLWRSVPMKLLVAVFAALHLAVWMWGELKRREIVASVRSGRPPRYLPAVVTAFDGVETLALLAIGWTAGAFALTG